MVAAAFWSIFTFITPADVKARWDQVAVMLAERFAKAAALMDSAETDAFAFTAFPKALASDLVEQPVGTIQQGDPPANELGRHLPQRSRRNPTRRRGARRSTRRVGRRSPLILRSVDGKDPRAARYCLAVIAELEPGD